MAYISAIKSPDNTTYDIKSYKTMAIPSGTVDSASTATAFTATIDGITALYDGVCVWLKNGVVKSASGCTLNINQLGAKPIYQSMSASTAVSTTFDVGYTMLFIYNSTRVSGGCWDMVYGYYTKSYHIALDPNTTTGTATTGTATTTDANYTPSGDILYETGEIEVTATLNYSYSTYVLSISGINATTSGSEVVTAINGFKGSGVNLIIEEDD